MTTRTKAKRAPTIAESVAEQFARLESTAAATPGLVTLLRVYGVYEDAQKQVDAYFALLNPPPQFTVKTTSG